MNDTIHVHEFGYWIKLLTHFKIRMKKSTKNETDVKVHRNQQINLILKKNDIDCSVSVMPLIFEGDLIWLCLKYIF